MFDIDRITYVKIVFLNTYNCTVKEPILKYIKTQSQDTDIFCLQEAYDKTRWFCQQLLPDYHVFSKYKYVRDDDEFPQATYVKNNLEILSEEAVLLGAPNIGLGLSTQIATPGGVLNVFNFHGVSKPGDKLDTPERLQQSTRIIEYLNEVEGAVVIGGDFNLEIDAESLLMFEKNGYRNLIKEYNVPTTRNRLVWEKYPEGRQYFSDYVFVTEDVKVVDFSVEDVEISDHLPMILTMETPLAQPRLS